MKQNFWLLFFFIFILTDCSPSENQNLIQSSAIPALEVDITSTSITLPTIIPTSTPFFTQIQPTITLLLPTSTSSNILSSTPLILTTGKIAFISQRDEYSTEIYVMNADGSEQTRLTNDLLIKRNPSWSPNGRMIAFETVIIHSESMTTQIRLINEDGTGSIALTPEHGNYYFPNWSPDSRNLVFTSDNWDIYSVCIDGSHFINLTNSSSMEISPKWSPDGSKIAFVSDSGGQFNIYMMNPDGTNREQLTDFQSNNSYSIYWSPDGKKLAVVTSDENRNTSLNVINSDGSGFALLAGGANNSEPSWSPSSDRIAFVSGSYTYLNVFVVKIDGSFMAPLTSNNWSDRPAWSPDGTRIAYSSDSDRTASYNFDIYVMSSEGGQPIKLTDDPESDSSPIWKP